MNLRLFTLGKVKGKYLFGILLVSALTLTISLNFFLQINSPVYLALAAPLSGEQQVNGEQILRGANLYIEKVNRSGGIDGHPVKLLVFDDENDPQIAKEKAQEISQKKKVLAVLGHFSSTTSIAAGEIYQQVGIPAISGSATAETVTQDNDWFFRTIFTNKSQGIFLANYARRILQTEKAAIIYEENDYGTSLAEAFENNFQGLGGKITNKWSFSQDENNFATVQEEIISSLISEDIEQPEIIFFATNEVEASQIIVPMKRNNLTYPILGADSLGKVTFSARFSQYPEEQAKPGFFSDNIYATSPLIFDVASEKAQEFRNDFLDVYSQEPSWTAANYYDAAMVAVAAIERAKIFDKNLTAKEKRSAVKSALQQINNPDEAVVGLGGLINFNNQGNILRQVPIGIFSQQKFIPALSQLQPVTDLKQIVDIETELESGNILIVDSRYMHKTNVVYTGMDVIKVSDLDLKSSSYTLDFYLWFRYRGDIKAEDIEFTNLVEPLQIKELIYQSEIDGLKYRAYRIKGVFQGDFNFQDYPFDKQTVQLNFRHSNLKRNQLVYVLDLVGMRDISNRGILTKFAQNKVFDDTSNWQLNRVRFFQDIIRSNSTLGNPKFLPLRFDDRIEYSRFNMAIVIVRNSRSFIIKNLLPVFLIIVAAYILLFLPADAIAPRAVAGLNALLTTGFFHIRLSNDLPSIGYVVAIEYIFYAMYALCLFGMFISIFSYVELKRNKPQVVKRLAQIGKTVYPTVLFVSFFLFTTRYILTPLWVEKTAINFPSQPNPLPVVVATKQDEDNNIPGKTNLTLGSWRIDDQKQIENILELFQKKNSQIKVSFTPTNSLDYQDILFQQLRENEAPDLFYVFPYSAAQKLISNDYLKPITNIDNLSTIFPPEALEPWQGEDGKVYALPVMAVSHGIYYNQNIFQELGLEIPTTWQELLSTATVLKNAGYISFANGSKVDKVLLENVFMNLAPNFIGGREGRLEYLSGKRCFNDANSVAAFQALANLRPFLPENHENLTKPGSKQLFVTGKAAMWMAGSWNISSLETSSIEFTWSIFAVPPPQGKAPQVTFQPDFAIGINPKSPHQQEAEQFIQWLSKKETASLWANELPGFFPLHKQVSNLKNIYAEAFLKLNQNKGTDARWAVVKLGDGLPDGYSLMETAVAEVIKGEMTPQQAADYLQSGLSQWFEPAQKCDIDN